VRAFAGTHRTGSGALYENTAYLCVKEKRENSHRQVVCSVNKGGTAESFGPLCTRHRGLDGSFYFIMKDMQGSM